MMLLSNNAVAKEEIRQRIEITGVLVTIKKEFSSSLRRR